MAAFVGTITRSGVVPPDASPALNAEVLRIHRWSNWWWPEAVCLLVAIVLEVTRLRLQMYGETGGFNAARTGVWFVVLLPGRADTVPLSAVPLIWKWALWCWFLWRVSRLNLHLIPGHPDRAGPRIARGCARAIHATRCRLFSPRMRVIRGIDCSGEARGHCTVSIADLAADIRWRIFLAPLLVFTDKLWDGRTKGAGRYMGLATRYVAEFEAKWLRNDAPTDPALLGSPDLQSLADLANAVSVVKGMRWVTIGPRLRTMITLAAVVPLAPLLLFQYPIAVLTQKFFSRLVGF